MYSAAMPVSTPTPSAATTAPRPARRLTRWLEPSFVDFWARHLSPSWSLQRPLARLLSVTPASTRAVTLLLKPNRHWSGALAGQHVNLGVEIDGRRLTRSYSLSAPPRADGCLEITVNAVEGGQVSPHLVHRARRGEVFEIGPGFGGLRLEAAAAHPTLMLAAGSGITPLMALIREQAACGMPRPITLAYWARTSEELCFREELLDLAARHPEFRIEFLLTAEGTAPASRIDAGQLSRLCPQLERSHVLACGPGGFVETARDLCAGAASFQAEGFSPAPLRGTESGTARLTLLRSGRSLDVPRDRPLLVALEEQGLRPAYGCRMGICHTCRCVRVEGISRDLGSGELDAEPQMPIRLCVSAAAGDLSLDL
jgi:ferredoxin-NADP reductase